MSELKQLFVILQKYMRHVEECEGVTFVSELNRTNVEFSDYEINFLKTVDAQINIAECCMCEFETLGDGSIIKTKECNFHNQ